MNAGIIAAIIIVVILVAGAAYLGTRSRRTTTSRRLKQQFGGEYDRVVEGSPDRTEAEKELERRVERHERLSITELSSEQQQRYVDAWRDVQRRFVDDPERTMGEADRLITQVMRDRGYPTEHYDQKLEDLSVEHAGTLDAYRDAHDVADRHERGGVSTDELRRAMQRYRTIFEDIVQTETTTGE